MFEPGEFVNDALHAYIAVMVQCPDDVAKDNEERTKGIDEQSPAISLR